MVTWVLIVFSTCLVVCSVIGTREFIRVNDEIEYKIKNDRKRLFEGDIRLPNNETSNRDLATMSNSGILWNNDMRKGYYWITVRISNSFSSETKNMMVNALRNLQWRSQVIRFDIVFRRPLTSKPYIHYVNAGDGCWTSSLGRDPEESMLPHGQLIMFEERICAKMDLVQHEMMHALGFGHEQSRPDRDDYVKIIWENIEEKRRKQFEIIHEVDSLGTPYDYDSILHYPANSWSKNGEPTIVGLNNNVIGNRMNASWIDILQIRLMYQCKSGPRNLLDYEQQKCSEDCQCWHNELGCGNNDSYCNDDMMCQDNRCILPKDKKLGTTLVREDLEEQEGESYFSSGVMFDVQAKANPIKITNLYYQGIEGDVKVDIYSKQWTHFKWSENEGKWDLIGSATLQYTPDDTPMLFPENSFQPILVDRWHRRGFYIQTRDCGFDCKKLRVWRGQHYAETTNPFMENDSARILEGCTLKGKFDNSENRCNNEKRGGESFTFCGGVKYIIRNV